MALINCPECGHQMSDTATKCPNCGYSNFRNNEIIKSIGNHKHYIISGVWGTVSLFIVFWGIGYSTHFSTSPIIIDEDFITGLIFFLVGIISLFFSCRLLKNKIKYYNKIFYIAFSICVVSLISTFFCLGITTEAIQRAELEASIKEAKIAETKGEAKRRVEEEASSPYILKPNTLYKTTFNGGFSGLRIHLLEKDKKTMKLFLRYKHIMMGESRLTLIIKSMLKVGDGICQGLLKANGN